MNVVAKVCQNHTPVVQHIEFTLLEFLGDRCNTITSSELHFNTSRSSHLKYVNLIRTLVVPRLLPTLIQGRRYIIVLLCVHFIAYVTHTCTLWGLLAGGLNLPFMVTAVNMQMGCATLAKHYHFNLLVGHVCCLFTLQN